MFEDYLEDAYFFVTQASKQPSVREQQRFYRAAVFYAYSSLEAFVNYIAEAFAVGNTLEQFESAFLLDRRFGLQGGEFKVLTSLEFHRLEDKLRFLLHKFSPEYDLAKEPSWNRVLALKELRDSIVHPRTEEDEICTSDYQNRLSSGLNSAIEIIDKLCQGIFSRPLRKKLLDLRL
jgi:hypothetical protein